MFFLFCVVVVVSIDNIKFECIVVNQLLTLNMMMSFCLCWLDCVDFNLSVKDSQLLSSKIPLNLHFGVYCITDIFIQRLIIKFRDNIV